MMMLMGVEPQISGVRSDHSTSWTSVSSFLLRYCLQACLSSFNYNLLVEIKANESCLNTLLSSFVKRKNKTFDIIEVFYLLIFAIKLLKQLKFVFFLRRILIWSNSAVFATERRIRRLRSAAIKIVFDAECLFPNVALKRLFTTFQATPVVFLAPRRFLWRHLTGVSVLT